MDSGPVSWRTTAVVAVVVALLASAATWLLVGRDADADDPVAAGSTAPSPSADRSPSGTSGADGPSDGTTDDDASGDDTLADALDGLLGGLGGLGDLDALLGEGGATDLAGGLDPADPRLAACIGADGAGGGSGIPGGDVDQQVRAIAQAVAADRGISTDEQLDVELTSRRDLAARARALTDEDIDDAEADLQARLLAALGVVPAGTDVEELLLDALDAAVAGYYDPETEQLVIGAETVDPLGALVVAHEVQHAVADDVLGLPDLEAIAESDGADAAAAALSLVEGDASLASQRYSVQAFTLQELLAVAVESLRSQDQLAGIPHLVSRELQFPYVEGLLFTCHVYLDGGWPAVDAGYVDPPTTTAQVLFPDRYDARRAPVDVPDVAAPRGWSVLDRDTFGAASLMFLFEAPGDDPTAALSTPLDRVSAWAGGEVTLFGRGGETALALGLVDGGFGPSLCSSVTAFARAAYDGTPLDTTEALRIDQGDRAVQVRCGGDRTWLLVAPSTADLTALTALTP